MPVPPSLPASPSALERPRKGYSVPPTLTKDIPLSQGRKHARSAQNKALTCANNGTWKDCVLSQRDRGGEEEEEEEEEIRRPEQTKKEESLRQRRK